jgi:hypothetical protein
VYRSSQLGDTPKSGAISSAVKNSGVTENASFLSCKNKKADPRLYTGISLNTRLMRIYFSV